MKTETVKTLVAWALAIATVAIPAALADLLGWTWALLVPLIAFIWAVFSWRRDRPTNILPMDRKRFKS